jgi:hypothetical protein
MIYENNKNHNVSKVKDGIDHAGHLLLGDGK